MSRVFNLSVTRQPHVKNSRDPQSCLFFSDFKPFYLFSSITLSLCTTSALLLLLPTPPHPHPSLSRTTGACLLSSQCFYSLALAQGSIQSGPCIHFASPIIHMLMCERVARAATHRTTLIECRWPFDSSTDHFTLLIKATSSLQNKSFIHFKCHT